MDFALNLRVHSATAAYPLDAFDHVGFLFERSRFCFGVNASGLGQSAHTLPAFTDQCGTHPRPFVARFQSEIRRTFLSCMSVTYLLTVAWFNPVILHKVDFECSPNSNISIIRVNDRAFSDRLRVLECIPMCGTSGFVERGFSIIFRCGFSWRLLLLGW